MRLRKAEGRPVLNEVAPLGVYIHWPYCARICPYCDFTVVRDRGRVEEQRALVEAIADDLAAHAALTGPRRRHALADGARFRRRAD
jgi:coproporphyrinogen III oxidase-like Fe-S oxidoreductase